jgi:nitrite reductase/ring-hydroxylating ferredoxin subunit
VVATYASAIWCKSPNAPAPGTSLGPLSEIPEGDAQEFCCGEGPWIFSMLVVRREDAALAYLNASPHVFLPLTYRSARVLSRDGDRLVCSNHFAEFAVEDGRVLSGPADPACALTPVPVYVDGDGSLVIGEPN